MPESLHFCLDYLQPLIAVLDKLNEILATKLPVTFRGEQVKLGEVIGLALGMSAQICSIYGKKQTWPLNVTKKLLTLWRNFQSHLVVKVATDIVLIFTSAFAWRRWSKAEAAPAAKQRLPIHHAATRDILIALVLACTFGQTVGYFCEHQHWFKAENPYSDAYHTGFQLAFYWFLSRKEVQAWWFTIASNIFFVRVMWEHRNGAFFVKYLMYIPGALVACYRWHQEARKNKEKEALLQTPPGDVS